MHDDQWEVRVMGPQDQHVQVQRSIASAAELTSLAEQVPYLPFHRLLIPITDSTADNTLEDRLKCLGSAINRVTRNQVSILGFGIALLIYTMVHVYMIAFTQDSREYLWMSLASIILVSMSTILLVVSATNRGCWRNLAFLVCQYAVISILQVFTFVRVAFADDLSLLFKVAVVRSTAVVPSFILQESLIVKALGLVSDVGLAIVCVAHMNQTSGNSTIIHGSDQSIIAIVAYGTAMVVSFVFVAGYENTMKKLVHSFKLMSDYFMIQSCVYTELQGNPEFSSKIVRADVSNSSELDLFYPAKTIAPKNKSTILGSNPYQKQTSRMSIEPRMPLNKIIHSRSMRNGLAARKAAGQSVGVELSQAQVQFEELIDHITLTLMTDFKLTILNPKLIKRSGQLETYCQNIKEEVIYLLETRRQATLRDVWARLVADVLCQTDLILSIDHVGLPSQDEQTGQRDLVRFFSIGTTWTRELYVRCVKAGFQTPSKTSGNPEIFFKCDSKYSPRRSIVAESIESIPLRAIDRKSILVESNDWELSDHDLQKKTIKKKVASNKKMRFRSDSKPQVIVTEAPEVSRAPGTPSNSQAAKYTKASTPEDSSGQMMEQQISVVVHDMRSPLMCIQGNLELIEFELIQQGAIYELVAPLIKSSTAASTLLEMLVNDVLDSARISKGIFKISENEMDLEETVHECLFTMEMAARSRNNVLEASFEDMDCKYIVSDKQRIKQVLLNFLSNSIKFTDNGMVKVIVESVEDNVQITVQDNGKGIKQDQLGKLFEKFNSDRETASNAKGIGLGLFICKSIIETLGPKNQIRVSSDQNVCTKISFKLFKDVTKSPNFQKVVAAGTGESRGQDRSYLKGSTSKEQLQAAKLGKGIKRRKSFDIFELNEQGVIESKRMLEVRRRHRMSPSKNDYVRYQTLPANGRPNSQVNTMNQVSEKGILIKGLNIQPKPTRKNDSELNILLLDDDDLIIELLEKYIEQSTRSLQVKAEHFQAQHIERALDLCKFTEMDIVVTDYNLEDGIGPDFIRRHQQQYGRSQRRPLFLLLTGEDPDSPEVKAVRSLYFDVLSKPVSLQTWLAVFKKCVSRLQSP